MSKRIDQPQLGPRVTRWAIFAAGAVAVAWGWATGATFAVICGGVGCLVGIFAIGFSERVTLDEESRTVHAVGAWFGRVLQRHAIVLDEHAEVVAAPFSISLKQNTPCDWRVDLERDDVTIRLTTRYSEKSARAWAEEFGTTYDVRYTPPRPDMPA